MSECLKVVDTRRFDLYRESISAQSTQDDFGQCADAIVSNVARSASLFKHPSFKGEAEWRIIISVWSGHAKLCFRASRRTVIPFMKTVKQENRKLPVVSVTIGPTLHQPLSRQSVQALLSAKGYSVPSNTVKIKESEIPLALTD
jgi:hypothetical protein